MFVGLKMTRSTNGAVGVIEGSFGKSGKFKVRFPDGGQSDTQGTLILQYKRYLYRDDKKLVQ